MSIIVNIFFFIFDLPTPRRSYEYNVHAFFRTVSIRLRLVKSCIMTFTRYRSRVHDDDDRVYCTTIYHKW